MMDANDILALLDLKPHADAAQSILVDRNICLGAPQAKHLSGGACTAILINALEHLTGKSAIQAQTQFLAAPSVDDRAEVHVDFHRAGQSIDIAGASLMVGDDLKAKLTAGLGHRQDRDNIDWSIPPDADEPEDCEPIPFLRADTGDLHAHLDMRLSGMPENGEMIFWVRAPPDFAKDASRFLAIVADYLPEAIHFNLGRRVGASSLDNTIRFVARVETEWLLCRTHLKSVRKGLFHGNIEIFAEAGQLLAFGSQSGVARAIQSFG